MLAGLSGFVLIVSNKSKGQNEQIHLQKLCPHHDHKYVLVLIVHGIFFLNCASAAQLFRAKFCGAAKTQGSEMLIGKQPGIYIIAHYCDCHCLHQ